MITVIIPVFNGEKYIRSSVESVLSQTMKCQVIIVDDGSTDTTEDICQSILKENSNVKYYKINNSGVSNARNFGILKSETDYISFLDADDIYESSFAEKMYDKITNSDMDVCYSGYFKVRNGVQYKNKMKFTNKKVLQNYLKNKTAPHTNSWLIKKKFLIEKEIFFEVGNNFGEDILFFSTLLLENPKVTYVDDYLTNYHVDVPSSLSKDSSNRIKNDIQWCNNLSILIKESNIIKSEKKKLISIVQNYRLSVAIVLSIKNDYEGKIRKRELLKENKKYIKIFNFSNGLRSLKGILTYCQLLVEII